MKVIGREGAARPLEVQLGKRDRATVEARREVQAEARNRREENRQLNLRIAEEASARRLERNRGNIVERVDRAGERLASTPPAASIAIIEALSPAEREVYLLAEETTRNRQEVLRMFPPPRKGTREQFEQSVAVSAAPEGTVAGVEVAEEKLPSPLDSPPPEQSAPAESAEVEKEIAEPAIADSIPTEKSKRTKKSG
jgi:hypothetical protein